MIESAGPRLSDEEVLALLGSRRRGRLGAADRQRASEELRRRGPAALDLLLPVIEREAAATKKRRPLLGAFTVGAVALMLGAIIVLALLLFAGADYGKAGYEAMFALAVAFVAWLLLQTTLFERLGPSPLYRAGVTALGEIDDVRCIGPLVGSLGARPTYVPPAIEAALTRLLPRVRATDRERLNTTQYAALLRILVAGAPRLRLTIAILQALEQIGDSAAIPVVERLAYRDPGSSIAVAANQCLPTLRQRAETERPGRRLLRPAEVQGSEVAMLLRPAHGSARTDAGATLLRAQAGAAGELADPSGCGEG